MNKLGPNKSDDITKKYAHLPPPPSLNSTKVKGKQVRVTVGLGDG